MENRSMIYFVWKINDLFETEDKNYFHEYNTEQVNLKD